MQQKRIFVSRFVSLVELTVTRSKTKSGEGGLFQEIGILYMHNVHCRQLVIRDNYLIQQKTTLC